MAHQSTFPFGSLSSAELVVGELPDSKGKPLLPPAPDSSLELFGECIGEDKIGALDGLNGSAIRSERC